MHIIAVDSSKTALGELCALLREVCPDAEVAPFQDPLFAIQYGLNHPAELVFTETMMVLTDGFALLDALRRQNPALRVFFVTSTEQYRDEALRRGAEGYLVKPVDAGRLRSAVGRPPEPGQPSSPAAAGRAKGSRAFIYLAHFISLRYNTLERACGRLREPVRRFTSRSAAGGDVEVFMELRLANVALDIFSALITLLLMSHVLLRPDRRERKNLCFAGICLSNVGMLPGDLPNWLCEGLARPWFPAALHTGILVQFLGGVGIPMAYAGYPAAYLSPKVRIDRRYLHGIGALGVLAVALVFVNLYNGMFYHIGGDNRYHRGGWWWLSQAIPIVIMMVTIAIVLRYRRCMARNTLVTLLSYQLLPLPAIILQGMFYGLTCTYSATTLAIVIIFLNIQSEQAMLLERKKRELSEAHASVMLSQIQPHFLYNVLTAVEELCAKDPPVAQRAVADFASYLRGNMRALTQPTPIPFAEELKHVRHYLNLEQIRFRGRLDIALEIGPTGFLVPPLSIQPIVENAVKHGVTRRKSGGRVTLGTEETPEAWVVTVSDDGVGFDPAAPAQDGREHVGIGNVRRRLASMCGGTLEIQSSPGAGAVVRLRLPKDRQRPFPGGGG